MVKWLNPRRWNSGSLFLGGGCSSWGTIAMPRVTRAITSKTLIRVSIRALLRLCRSMTSLGRQRPFLCLSIALRDWGLLTFSEESRIGRRQLQARRASASVTRAALSDGFHVGASRVGADGP